MTTTKNILDWFINNPYKEVQVNGVSYPCQKNLPTQEGLYKNGYIVKILNHKGKQFIQIDVYTSAGSQIDIEERFLFNEKYKVKKWIGWNNFNLLANDHDGEYMDMLKAFYNENKEEVVVEEQLYRVGNPNGGIIVNTLEEAHALCDKLKMDYNTIFKYDEEEDLRKRKIEADQNDTVCPLCGILPITCDCDRCGKVGCYECITMIDEDEHCHDCVE